MEFTDGRVHYYKGEKGAERVVRVQLPNGQVRYYEGERGAERMVREEHFSGTVQHYEGEQGAERVPTCTSRILEGRSGAQVGLSCS